MPSVTQQYIKAASNIFIAMACSMSISAMAEFVPLPAQGFNESAYTQCNATGNFGLGISEQPAAGQHDQCAIFLPSNNVMRLPASEKYFFKKVKVRMVEAPAAMAGQDANLGTVTDIVWRNQEDTECIYGALVHTNDVLLANGQSWEVNDLVRGGFAGRQVSAAYYFARHPKSARTMEAIFRIGRSHTSVRHMEGEADLPGLDGAPSPETAISTNQKAAVSENWVDFTTDQNSHDPDGSSFPDGSVMYVKTSCTADEPQEFEGAIRLRTTGQNGQLPLEIRIPGFAPTGADMSVY